MSTGKTNPKHYRLFADEFNLSGDSRTFGSCGVAHEETEVTGWSDGVKNFTLGHPRAYLEGYNAVFNNTALTGSHIALNAVEEYLVSLLIGIRAAPAVGDPCFAAPLIQKNYVVAGEGPIMISVDFPGPEQGHTLPGNGRAFGAVLEPGESTLSATTTNASVDNAAATTTGCTAQLHITTSSGGTWAFTIEHSTDNSSWATLITFSANGSAVTAEQGVTTGTVNRYVRFVATRTSGTVKVACTFVRQ